VAPVSAEEVAVAAARGRRLVVLDDDPTGTQTVADVPIVTSWDDADLRWALRQEGPGCYVLTNTRSLASPAAAERTAEVMAALARVSSEEGIDVAIASRSDSTLRGHFPLETDVLAATYAARLGRPVDGIVIAPAYIDAGRVTVDSVHWVCTPAGFVPAGSSEFAADPAFGYAASDLRDYVAEKTGGRWRREDVARITIDDLRRGGVGQVTATLLGLEGGRPVVVDAAADEDLRVLALAGIEAERSGRTFIYRVGPSFVRNRLGQQARRPLSEEELAALMRRTGSGARDVPRAAGGLIVVGSYVGLTTRQLDRLLTAGRVRPLALDVGDLLESRDPAAMLGAIAAEAQREMARGDVVIHTSREQLTGGSGEASLAIGARVSAGLVEIVRTVMARTTPRWIVAKGGITSSDLATDALGIRRAWARGTLLPGIVSLWEPVGGAADSLPYVVFAGNVGDDDALVSVASSLQGAG
jgi:uncharacterized protein YgbK (DUF1537 family)